MDREGQLLYAGSVNALVVDFIFGTLTGSDPWCVIYGSLFVAVAAYCVCQRKFVIDYDAVV